MIAHFPSMVMLIAGVILLTRTPKLPKPPAPHAPQQRR
jgi:hypothetical protein